MRKNAVAQLAGVSPADVQQMSVDQLRQALADRVPAIVLEVATQEPATYWRVGNRYFFDDPFFGPVVDMAELDYNSQIGLHLRET